MEHAAEVGATRVRLLCASASGKALYAKCGFTKVRTTREWAGVEMDTMVRRTAVPRRFVRRVVVTGGVHGNELVGVHLVRGVWGAGLELVRPTPDGPMPVVATATHPDLVRASLTDVRLVLANPLSARKCVRFLDKDLNRCFHERDLDAASKVPRLTTAEAYELRVAREIQSALGLSPKRTHPTAGNVDLLIDIHNTTSNMVSLIVLQGDALHLRLFRALSTEFKQLTLLVTPKSRHDDDNIDSLPRSGVCFELGPLPHGTLSHSLVDVARGLVRRTMDFLHARNEAEEDDDDAFRTNATITEDTVPGYEFWKALKFPTSKRVTDAPNADEAGFVSAAAIHPDRIGRDFELVKRGDPVFVDLDTGAVVAYDEDEPAHTVFVGEAAYFPGGSAMGLCRRKSFLVL